MTLFQVLIIFSIVAASIIVRSTAAKPNIIFILVDDLGFGDVNFNRDQPDPEIVTPNMDELVQKEGLHLMRHYVHFSCTPTRSSFQTGFNSNANTLQFIINTALTIYIDC